jgi:molybdenum cofactor biosynthesis protein B
LIQAIAFLIVLAGIPMIPVDEEISTWALESELTDLLFCCGEKMNEINKKVQSIETEHHCKAGKIPPAHVAVVTISDSRTQETDTNGQYLKLQIEKSGFQLTAYYIVQDDPEEIETLLEELCKLNVQLILFNGGTGISKRDTTYDVLSRKLEKVMPGFGEIFRMLSYDQVGAAAMFSRATAGVYQSKVIISIPGSPAAVQLAWEKLIAPEIQHLVWEISR